MMLLRRGENGEVCDQARELVVADWMSADRLRLIRG